jgi:hypothetical protein
MRIQKITPHFTFLILLSSSLLFIVATASQKNDITLSVLDESELRPTFPADNPSSNPAPTDATDEEPSQIRLPGETGLDPADWRMWPIKPVVTQHIREIYTRGQLLGNDPYAFSIFGDCQGVSDVFLGPFITDPDLFAALPMQLKETARLFENSLIRSSPTAKSGTTSGALLWEEWHENKYDCSPTETPMDCELRIHNPSVVLIMVGTHWEGSRNEFYMRRILDDLLALGIVPILSTKADNREGDNSINLQTAQLAAEYNIPLWNFWPVTAHLPNRGLYTSETESHLGDVYLTEDALALRRFYALQALDVVLRTVSEY